MLSVGCGDSAVITHCYTKSVVEKLIVEQLIAVYKGFIFVDIRLIDTNLVLQSACGKGVSEIGLRQTAFQSN